MLPTFDFITALKFASHAMATNDVRDYLNGVLFRFVGDTLLLTGSDGHRIAKVRLNLKGCPLSGDYIVRCDSIKEVLQTVKTKQTDKSETRIEPAQGNRDRLLLFARGGGYVLCLETRDGRYPDFERAIPNRDPEGCATIGINAPYLEAAAKALKPFSDSQYSGLLVDTWTPGETMRLRAKPQNSALSCIDGEATVHIMPMRL